MAIASSHRILHGVSSAAPVHAAKTTLPAKQQPRDQTIDADLLSASRKAAMKAAGFGSLIEEKKPLEESLRE